MSWLKRLFKGQGDSKRAPQNQTPSQPQSDPAFEEYKAQLIELNRQAAFERLTVPYRSIFALLDERYIVEALNQDKLEQLLATPDMEFDKDTDYMRIVPPPEATLADMERFWNSLRAIQKPIAFDLVSNPEEMYFRLVCPEGGGALIEQQLLIHFPTATCIVEDHEWSEPDTLCITFIPEDGTQFLDSSSVARDMYAQLFPLLDDPDISEELTIQVICHPIPDKAITILCDLLDWKEPGIPIRAMRQGWEALRPWIFELYWNILTDQSLQSRNLDRVDIERWFGPRHERLPKWPRHIFGDLLTEQDNKYPYLSHSTLAIMANHIYEKDKSSSPLADNIASELEKAARLAKQSVEMKNRLEKKQPAWVTCINVFSNQQRVIDQIHQRYLQRFEAAGQRWQKEVDKFERDRTERPINNWNLVSTEELASLAHFPTKGVSSPRLETADRKTSLPPENFIID